MKIKLRQILLENLNPIEIIMEARAIDRRIDALSKGIIPINGSNWNADRKNPNKVNKALDLSNQIKKIDNTITKYGGISPHKEYSGHIENGKIIPRAIGTRQSAVGIIDRTTFHKHPNNQAQQNYQDGMSDYFKNRPISTPSGMKKQRLDAFSFGDYDASTINALSNKHKKHTEYIFSPNTKSNTISQINTSVKDIDTTPIHKTSFFSKNAKKYYDLNGNLKNGANDYTNPTNPISLNNIPDFKLLDNIKALKAYKLGENYNLNYLTRFGRKNKDKEYIEKRRNEDPNYQTYFEKEIAPIKNSLRTSPVDFKELNKFFNKEDKRKVINKNNYLTPFDENGYRKNNINDFRIDSPIVNYLMAKGGEKNIEKLYSSMYKEHEKISKIKTKNEYSNKTNIVRDGYESILNTIKNEKE